MRGLNLGNYLKQKLKELKAFNFCTTKTENLTIENLIYWIVNLQFG